MTLEEAIQLANNGDQEAMFQLGQYITGNRKNSIRKLKTGI